MKVLLSNPPWFVDGGRKWGIRAGSRWPFTTPPAYGYLPFPFLLAYATSYLRKQGIQAHLVDSVLTRESVDSYFERIRHFAFDYVVIETSTPSIENDLAIARQAAQHTKVILTGPHATIFADELMAQHNFIWGIAKGEYEKNLHRMLAEGKGGIYDYELTEDLMDLPWPYRDSTIYRYEDRFPNSPPGPILQIHGSRGCPFTCIFCLWPPVMYRGNKYRPRQADDIIAEIIQCFRSFPKLTSVYFDDDTFNIGKERILQICAGMKQLGIPWSAMCRADTSDLETFRAMADSGCYAVKFGIESGCQQLVDRCQKNLDLTKVEESVKFLKSLGVFVHVTYTWGLPGETEETIRMTQEFNRRLQPNSAQQSFCTPFPGTPFYTMLKRAGELNMTGWREFDGATGSIMGGSDLPPERLKELAKL